MKISREQIEFMKNASDHVDRLCGGRGYGKTHQLIKEMEDKIYQLQSNWNSLRELIEQYLENEKYSYMSDNPKDRCRYDIFMEIKNTMNELEGNDNNGK